MRVDRSATRPDGLKIGKGRSAWKKNVFSFQKWSKERERNSEVTNRTNVTWTTDIIFLSAANESWALSEVYFSFRILNWLRKCLTNCERKKRATGLNSHARARINSAGR